MNFLILERLTLIFLLKRVFFSFSDLAKFGSGENYFFIYLKYIFARDSSIDSQLNRELKNS